MRIIHAAVICGLVVTSGACGIERPTYAHARATAQAVRLRAMLGGIDQLPEGFSNRLRARWKPPFRPRNKACRMLFDAAAGKPPRDGLSGTTSATYEGVHVGELAAVGLAMYGGNEAAGHLGELRDAMEECVTADAGTPGAGDRLSASDLPMGEVGDDVEARRLTGRVGGYPYEMHVVVASSGHTLIALVHAGLTAPDAGRTEELTRLLTREVGNLEP